MKTMKALILGVLVSTTVLAGNDPVVEQINITKDAVTTALEELSRGGIETHGSHDADLKMKQFSADASKALTTFEEAVRVRVLQSLSVMVNQYRAAYSNASLGSARQEVLQNLLKQIEVIAQDKSQIYRTAYLELYKILPNFPVLVDFKQTDNGRGLYADYDSSKVHPMCMEAFNGSCDHNNFYHYRGEVYMANGEIKNYQTTVENVTYDANPEGAYTLLNERLNFMGQDDVRRQILSGCYTSTCYFLMQSQFTIWKSMVESTLARDIVIELVDGTKVNITRKIARNQGTVNVMDKYLTNIKTEGLINNLPYEASEKRVEILSNMNNAIAQNSCGKAKKMKNNLCQETQEGCMKDSEIALFKDRFGSKASCL